MRFPVGQPNRWISPSIRSGHRTSESSIGDLVQIPGCSVLYDGPKDLPLQRYEKEGWPWLGQDLVGRCGTAIIPLDKAEQAIEPLKRLPFLRQLVIHSQSDDSPNNEIILRTLRKELELERIQMKIDLSL